MDIDTKALKKNLSKTGINTGKNAQENILGNNLKNNIIQRDIADANKTLDREKLINTQKVTTGLKADDAEYLQDVIDMDLYREYNINFENLPKYRLAREKSILKKGPKHMKGCTKWWARRKWKKKQKARVKAAEKLLKEHTKLLTEYEEYKADRLLEVLQNNSNITAFFANQEQEGQGGDVAEMLSVLNDSLARDAIMNLNQSKTESINELDTFLKNYVIDESTAEADRKAKTAKDQAKRKKKADKTGKIAADEEIIQDRENLENELLNRGAVKNRTLKTEVMDLEGKNTVQLADISQLFKKVLSDSDKPFSEEKEENGHRVQRDLRAQRYADM